MLKKRLIGCVIVKKGWAVQSIGYQRYLPLGKPECLIENLDRWGADEIFVICIDRADQGPDKELLNKLAKLRIKTPLIYGGGICSLEDGKEAIQFGADRISLDGLLHDDLEVVAQLSEELGKQALIASLPLIYRDNKILWRDYRKPLDSSTSVQELTPETLLTITSEVLEILVIDSKNEGKKESFDEELINRFPENKKPLLAFGGLSEPRQISHIIEMPSVAAVAIGNFLSYEEHAIQRIKETINSELLRNAHYREECSLK